MPFAAQVLVVGAGPVGLSAALALRSLGLDVLVLESEPPDRTRPGSRAIFVHHEPLAVLDSFYPGIARRILDAGILWTRRRYTYRGRQIYLREYTHPPQASLTYGTSQSQRETERILMEAAVSVGVRFQWGTPVVSVEASPDGIAVNTASGEVLRAAYVIGADGGRSAVRKSLGIAMEGSSSDVPFVVADFGELPDHPLRPELAFHYEHPALGGRNLLMVPMKGAWRIDVQCLPGDDVGEWSSEAGIKQWLSKVVDPHSIGEIQWVSTYRFHQLVASRMADETRRVLLIGEAAHLFAPWGGRGLNSGIMDAASAARAIHSALEAKTAAEARQAIDEFSEDRRDAALFNKGAAAYGLELLAPASLRAKMKRRIAGMVAPYY
ncbi:MAG: FAD-dependent monooxygenase, partial [Bryobacteraceae bacterium]